MLRWPVVCDCRSCVTQSSQIPQVIDNHQNSFNFQYIHTFWFTIFICVNVSKEHNQFIPLCFISQNVFIGLPVQSDVDFKQSALITRQLIPLRALARSVVRTIDPDDDLISLRVASDNKEYFMMWDDDFMIASIQKVETTGKDVRIRAGFRTDAPGLYDWTTKNTLYYSKTISIKKNEKFPHTQVLQVTISASAQHTRRFFKIAHKIGAIEAFIEKKRNEAK